VVDNSVLDMIEKLAELKEKSIITGPEFERKKAELLMAATSPNQANAASATDSGTYVAHGVSLVVGAIILFLICVGFLSDDITPRAKLNEALGFIILFGVWIVPHSIWLFSRPAANRVLPIVALVILALSSLAYAGST
jgi:hypothetical protein